MKIGIFGGTFDPPHVGHLILTQEAREQLSLDSVLWVLTPYPPHKKHLQISNIEDRLAMVLLAIENNPYFNLSRVDIDRAPPHYAVDTVNLLRQKSPRETFYYLMGADSLNDLREWHEPEKFIDACDGLGIMKRPGEDIDAISLIDDIPELAEKLNFLTTPIIEISGSDIRDRARNGKQFRYLVPDKVYHYILNHRLYLI